MTSRCTSAGPCDAHRDGGPADKPCPTLKRRAIVPNPQRPGSSLVPLTRGYVATIDDSDVAVVSQKTWHVAFDGPCVYARAHHGMNGRRYKKIRLHRFLWEHWGLPASDQLDHINGDGLDCRRVNIRAATARDNSRNRGVRRTSTSGITGVTWHKGHGKWYARICVNGKLKGLGLFADQLDAARAYRDAAKELFGEFARTT